MKRSLFFSLPVILLLIPATLFFGSKMAGRSYYLTSTLIILEIMLPFFIAFETRKPQARELVMVAVMCALSTAARIVMPFPNLKPMTAIIMLTGIAFGPEAGFLTGAVSAFASNFFYSHGPWTPWQMMSYGISGFLAGILFYRQQQHNFPDRKNNVFMAVFGFLCVLFVTGPLLDCCTIFTVSSVITKKFVFSVFAAGLPHNLSHAAATAVTIYFFGNPLLAKLNRLKQKYGILELSSLP